MARRTGVIAVVAIAGALVIGVLASIGSAGSSENGNQRMSGYFEVPSVSTVAQGRFELRIRDTQIDYSLTFSGLEGNVTQAHIHFAQPGVNGGITAWLCETATNPGPGTFDKSCLGQQPHHGDDRGGRCAADREHHDADALRPGHRTR